MRVVPLLIAALLASSCHAGGFVRRRAPVTVGGATSVSDAFTDGDFTADPTWTQVDVANGAWGVTSQRLRFTGSGANMSGGLYTALASGRSIQAIIRPISFTTKPTQYNLKICTVVPTQAEKEAGCYTAELTLDDGFVTLTTWKDTGTSGGGCTILGDLPDEDHTLTLTISGGTVTSTIEPTSCSDPLTDSTYTSGSYVALGVDTGRAALAFDDVVGAQ